MKTIFVQVKSSMGQAYSVASQIVEREGVSEVHSTSGHYDLMVKCHLSDDQDTGHYVTNQIQTLDGVHDTFTIIAFNAFS